MVRWLIEVFFGDWKGHEGWGKLTKHTGEDGSRSSLILSLLLDHVLFFHHHQKARLENKIPAWTVGSLSQRIHAEALVQFVQDFCENEISVSMALSSFIIRCAQFYRVGEI